MKNKFFVLCKHLSYVFFSILLLIVLLLNAAFAQGNSGGEKLDGAANIPAVEKVVLTPEEAEFLKSHPTLTVAVDASWRPIEYVDKNTNKYMGVIPEVLTKVGQYTGFKVEYLIMNSYSEALEAVQSGKADMVSGLANDQAMADEYQVSLSAPYITINSAIVSKGNSQGLYQEISKKKIAVVAGDYANPLIQKKIPNVELMECSSSEECLDKVNDDSVDLAIIAAYCAEYYIRVPKYSELSSYTIADFSWNQSFGVSNTRDKLLTAILNKGIHKLTDWDINQAVYQGVMGATYENEWQLFIYRHHVGVIAGILIIVLIIGILLAIISKIKRKADMRKIADGARLSLALSRTKLCIWEIDLITKKIIKIDNENEKHGFYNFRDNIPDSVVAAGYIHPEDLPVFKEVMNKVFKGEQDIVGSWRVKEMPGTGDATTFWWEQVHFHIIFDNKQKPIRAIGISEDVTKEKLAQRDSLTSVYNRKSFEQQANFILKERRNAYLQCAFLILDLDGFKSINDNYGHAIGDKVLMDVGATLTKTFRSSDIVGRLGGDEFIVFMTSISAKENAVKKAAELVENVRNISQEKNYPFAISCSVGAVVAERGKDDFAKLYKNADDALYEAKHAGKNQFKFYE